MAFYFKAILSWGCGACALRHLLKGKLELYLFPRFTLGESKILIENQDWEFCFFILTSQGSMFE